MLRKDTHVFPVSQAWCIKHQRHLLRSTLYKGRQQDDDEECPIKLPFNTLTFPGFFLVVARLHMSLVVSVVPFIDA